MELIELLAKAVNDEELKNSLLANFAATCEHNGVTPTPQQMALFEGVDAEDWDYVQDFVTGAVLSSPCAFK